MDHVQGLCYNTACFSSEVVQAGIPELDIGFMGEPALIDEQRVDLVQSVGDGHHRRLHISK